MIVKNISTDETRLATVYRDAGLSVVPLRLDGSKGAMIKWAEYQTRLPTDDEIRNWWSRPAGIAIITGVVSGGLEILDFDAYEVFPPWESMLPRHLRGWLPVIETGGGGCQVYYRCSEVCGNSKIAMDGEPSRITKEGRHIACKSTTVRIETRGEGGYVVAPGSPASVHKSGRPYVQVLGTPLPQIPTISKDDRKLLWENARQFHAGCDPWRDHIDKRARELSRKNLANLNVSGDEPWVRFDAWAPWRDILEPLGWTSFDGVWWKRPGKDAQGCSAVVRQSETTGNDVLIVFSSNAGELSPIGSDKSRTFGAFDVFKILHHAGDGKQAAKAAAAMMMRGAA